MPVVFGPTIFEKWKSRSGRQSPEDPSIDIVYGVLGTDDETIMNALVQATVLPTWNGLTLQGWEHSFEGGVALNGTWEVTVHYDRKDPKGPGTAQFSFDTSGGQQHITQSKQTLELQPDPLQVFAPLVPKPPQGLAPDCKGAINVTDTSVDGCDVTVPKMEFTITCIALADDLPSTFLMDLRDATGTVNDRPFLVAYQGQILLFKEYEVLFLGAPGNYRGDGSWEFNLKFSASLTVNNEIIGSGDTAMLITEKRGWDYLWVKYKEGKDPTAKVFTRTPLYAYVEQVYDPTNFDDLFAPLNLEA